LKTFHFTPGFQLWQR